MRHQHRPPPQARVTVGRIWLDGVYVRISSQYADLVERAIATLGLDGPIVVAHSMGTPIAADLTARRPDLTSLILIGPVVNASSGPFPGRRSGSCSRRGRKSYE
jgi:pimeloyl-ACP methyl ester carboxylesterase